MDTRKRHLAPLTLWSDRTSIKPPAPPSLQQLCKIVCTAAALYSARASVHRAVPETKPAAVDAQVALRGGAGFSLGMGDTGPGVITAIFAPHLKTTPATQPSTPACGRQHETAACSQCVRRLLNAQRRIHLRIPPKQQA